MIMRHFTWAIALVLGGTVFGQLPDWQHSGSMYVLTNRDGAGLPAEAAEKGFPLLVRLHKDFFDFGQARPDGQDVRFMSRTGTVLPHQVEEWDPEKGEACIWVRLPVIRGDSRQEIRMYWGNPNAQNVSDGKAVFNAANGYLSVFHMNDPVRDDMGTVEAVDSGTTSAVGMIGGARHFPGRKGINCGEKITGYPTGAVPHSSEAWFRAETVNSTVLAWGNEQAQGKVVLKFAGPPHVRTDCYFSNGNVQADTRLAVSRWVHVVHTYTSGDSRLYVNGVLAGVNTHKTPPLAIRSPARLYIGGWYNRYAFVGDIDEVRVSTVARSADWVRLQYENQKSMQTLVGPLVSPGDRFSVKPTQVTVPEGGTATVTAEAQGALKLYWILKAEDREDVVAVDRLSFTFAAGRVRGNQSRTLQLKAVYPNEVRTRDITVLIEETVPEPIVTLQAPGRWDGRAKIEIVPVIANSDRLRANGAGELRYSWALSGLAATKEITPGKLTLTRGMNSGTLTVQVTVDNGGPSASAMTTVEVKEPEHDGWVTREPATEEMPQDNQLYARDDTNVGTLICCGTLAQPADSVFLRVFCEDKLYAQVTRELPGNRVYSLSAELKPGLVTYRTEFGSRTGARETILRTAANILCGDAYIIEGQSNALATDTREEAPREASPWIRSYGYPGDAKQGASQNLWCTPVWKFERGPAHRASRAQYRAELGWWGMDLAKRLVASQKIPICIINGAVGGTRIDQHQPKPDNREDLGTIYGRLLWRVRQARLTHGIRAVLWHQGENNQGAAGPDGDYGWKTYEQYFVNMAAAWKQDFPNIGHYYIFQIWPNACSMGNGHGNMLREVQRSLPRLYSNMDVIPTVGIRPPGPCHYPLAGWTEFARLVHPLIARDFYGQEAAGDITAPDLRQARYENRAGDAIALEFDQPVLWEDSLINEFYLDGANGKVASGTTAGKVLILKLKAPSTAREITYLDERSWGQDRLLMGRNGIAALTFCGVPIAPSPDSERGTPTPER